MPRGAAETIAVRAATAGLLAALATATAMNEARAAEAERQLDEVVVRATRLRTAGLRKQMIQLEDQFFSKYNELNTQDDFDVHCFQEVRTGTKFGRRYCRAVCEDKAMEAEGQDSFRIRQNIQEQFTNGVADPMLPASPPAPAVLQIEARRPAFQANVRKVVAANKELLDILAERARLLKQYEALMKRVPRGRTPAGNRRS